MRSTRRRSRSLVQRQMPPAVRETCYSIDRTPLACHGVVVPVLLTFSVAKLSVGEPVCFQLTHPADADVRDSVVSAGQNAEDIFEKLGLAQATEAWGRAVVRRVFVEEGCVYAQLDVGGIRFFLKEGQSFSLRGEKGQPWRPRVRVPELAIVIGEKPEIACTADGELLGHYALVELLSCDSDGVVVSVEGVVFPVAKDTGFVVETPELEKLPGDDEAAAEIPPLPIYVSTLLGGGSARFYIGAPLEVSPAFCARPYEKAAGKIPVEDVEDGEPNSPAGTIPARVTPGASAPNEPLAHTA